MPRFFVCEEGLMGGCQIVFVCDTHRDAMKWIGENGKGRDLFAYQQIFAA